MKYFSQEEKLNIRIRKATLIVSGEKISTGILLVHANALAKTTAKYPLSRVVVKSFNMHSGIVGDTLDNVILGQLLKRIILGFVKNRAFNGNRRLPPLPLPDNHAAVAAIFDYKTGLRPG